MGELPSQSYTLFNIPQPQMSFVHIHPGAEELGRVYSPTLPIHATPTALPQAAGTPRRAERLRGDAEAAQVEYLAWTEARAEQPGQRISAPSSCGYASIFPSDPVSTAPAIVSRPLNSSLLSLPPLSAAYRASVGLDGLWRSGGRGDEKALSGAARGSASPAMATFFERPFATAPCNTICISSVLVNGIYGTIRMRRRGAEVSQPIVATELRNPDFAAYARAFGGFGVNVDTAVSPAACEEAQLPASRRSSALAIDPEAITPMTTLAKIRAKFLTQ